MSHVVLLGDSIFDNAAYVGGGSPLIEQLRERLRDGEATLLAVDGSLIEDVHRQLERLPDSATHLVVSVGGNDVLAEIGVLGKRAGTVGEGIRCLADIRDRFEYGYQRLVETLRERALSTLVCTIYNPCFADEVLQREAVAALCLFNDVILGEARRAGLPVLDLRAVCTAGEDYATPIEPSTTGGVKIAEAIRAIVQGHDFASRAAVLFPR